MQLIEESVGWVFTWSFYVSDVNKKNEKKLEIPIKIKCCTKRHGKNMKHDYKKFVESKKREY